MMRANDAEALRNAAVAIRSKMAVRLWTGCGRLFPPRLAGWLPHMPHASSPRQPLYPASHPTGGTKDDPIFLRPRGKAS